MFGNTWQVVVVPTNEKPQQVTVKRRVFSLVPEHVRACSHNNDYLKSIKSNKACGYDGIPAKLIKCGAAVLSLTALVNQCFTSMTYPDILKRAIYKKLDHLCTNNYRPINVLSDTSK